MHYLNGYTNSNDNGFVIWSHVGQKEVAQHILSTERKELSTAKPIYIFFLQDKGKIKTFLVEGKVRDLLLANLPLKGG